MTAQSGDGVEQEQSLLTLFLGRLIYMGGMAIIFTLTMLVVILVVAKVLGVLL